MNSLSTTSRSPFSRTTCTHENNQTMCDVLNQMGFVNIAKVADTLQGCIYRATESLNHSQHSKVVIKTTNKTLHKNATATIKGEKNHIEENINIEQSILKYLTQDRRCPKSIVQFRKFLQTNTDYCLIMEDGGNSLFKFIMKAHKLIEKDKISIKHWHQVIKVIFRQMIECIDYIHSMNICHFDISLENFLINDVEVKLKRKKNKKQRFRFVLDDIQIKLCDFGLAECFPNIECRSSKFVGKKGYASPEIIGNNRGFDAKKNDIWCIGVCLFYMSTGLSPFTSAQTQSQSFKCIVENDRILDVLKAWNVLKYVDDDSIEIFKSIFQYERNRVNLEAIKKQINM